MKLVLNCTTKCNFSCPYCLRGKQKPKDFLKLLKKVLEEARELGFDFIVVTGGESYLHSKFKKMLDLIVEKGFNFSIVTNGYYVEDYEEIMKKYRDKMKYISFSIDGSIAKIHNLQRQCNLFSKGLLAE